jgi:hypothetical protein
VGREFPRIFAVVSFARVLNQEFNNLPESTTSRKFVNREAAGVAVDAGCDVESMATIARFLVMQLWGTFAATASDE